MEKKKEKQGLKTIACPWTHFGRKERKKICFFHWELNLMHWSVNDSWSSATSCLQPTLPQDSTLDMGAEGRLQGTRGGRGDACDFDIWDYVTVPHLGSVLFSLYVYEPRKWPKCSIWMQHFPMCFCRTVGGRCQCSTTDASVQRKSGIMPLPVVLGMGAEWYLFPDISAGPEVPCCSSIITTAEQLPEEDDFRE